MPSGQRPSQPLKRLRFAIPALVAALIAVLVGMFGTSLSIAPTAHAQIPCKKYEIIGVRGSGEDYVGPHQMGYWAGKAADAAANYLYAQGYVTSTSDIAYVSLQYPAIAVYDWTNIFGGYGDSVRTGIDNLGQQLATDTSDCPEQQVLLIGYSQGAQVVHQRIDLGLTTAERNAVAGVLLVADPVGDDSVYYAHVLNTVTGVDEGNSSGGGVLEDTIVPEPMAHRTFAICLAQDGVCGGSHLMFGAHQTYDTVGTQVDVLTYWGAAVARFSSPAGQSSTGAIVDGLNTARMFVRGTDNMDHETYLPDGAITYSALTAGTGPSGTTVASDPVAVVDHHNIIHVFVRGGNGKLYERHHNATTGWSGWTSLGGSIVGRPRAVVDANNTVRVYVHGSGANGHLDEIYLLNSYTTWSAYIDTGLVPLGDGVPVVDYDGVVRVYAINTVNNLVERYLKPGQTWSAWSTLLGGSNLIGDPTPIVDPRNIVRVYVRDQSHFWEASLVPGHTWGFTYMSEDATGLITSSGYNPVVFADHDDTIRVYVNYGTHLRERYLIPGHTWSNWGDLQGNIRNPLAVEENADDLLCVFAHDTDNTLGQDCLPVGHPWSGIYKITGATLA